MDINVDDRIKERSDAIVQVRDLSKEFEVGAGQTLKAVDRVSFDILRGEILGLVGESGCGKTTLGRTIKLLYTPTSGTLTFDGEVLDAQNKVQKKRYARHAQMIFQDPYSSLDPRMTVGEIIAEGMEIHGLHDASWRRNRVLELLDSVGLNREHYGRFPHEFSGGQRQRIGIARALAVDPEFIVCDEPISALDVSIQAQIVNLFKSLRQQLHLTYLFVAHDLSMVKYISDRVAVMYLGRIVEISEAKELYSHPMHPYTEYLLSAIPIPDPRAEAMRRPIEAGQEVGNPINLPAGCSFRPRCKYADESCKSHEMSLHQVEANHFSACTRADHRA
ncbi:ABC transporter ATP-binding protein [Clostridia bacterium]|nr:ABC transporter ATP-binding protein [Clostridia bacterium]